MSLAKYRQKRTFALTPEPRGSVRKITQRTFVVQKHAASRLHYDFRLELDGTLKSWAVPKGPSLDPRQRRLAVHVEDHPIEYGSFEGVIPPRQYGAGSVLLWDRGKWLPDGDPSAAYRKGKLKFHLEGEKLHGGWNLVRMRKRSESDKDNWLLIKERDAAARTGPSAEVTQRLSNSVASGLDIQAIAAHSERTWDAKKQAGRTRPASDHIATLEGASKRPMLPNMRPALATLVEQVPNEDGWLFEIKYDGYRMLSRVANGNARLFTRSGKDWTAKVPRLAEALASLPVQQAWLDGEIVVVGPDGAMSFQALQNAFDARSDDAIVYYLFDLPYLNGHDLSRVPLHRRKLVLSEILRAAGSAGRLRFSDHLVGQEGDELYRLACRRGLEGIIAKRADSVYVPVRTKSWLKIKCGREQEFVIGGFSEPAGSRKRFGALLLGVYDKAGRLCYAGRVGTGFTEESLRDLHTMLAKLEQAKAPFFRPPAGSDARGVHWVKPQLVAQVAFAEWTEDQVIRQGSFRGLRRDKLPRTVVRETDFAGETAGVPSTPPSIRSIEKKQGRGKTTQSGIDSGATIVAGVNLTHPKRVLYPGQQLTKLDVARYYERVAEWILPHLQGRPLTLLRCPDGHEQECFYQKHANESVPSAIGRVQIQEDKGSAIYMKADSLPALIGLVQMGVLELHTWGAVSPRLDRPDRLTFDLDPDPDLPWSVVIEAATLTRGLLQELELQSFLKTTGGQGLHVVVPVRPIHTWAEVKAFA
ncbi:MAG: DNA ligase D [Nitrospiraceae bacterium]